MLQTFSHATLTNTLPTDASMTAL